MLTKEGTVLAQRLHQGWTVSLYSLHNRYVELWEKNGLQITTSFRNDAAALAIVEPYLAYVDVQHLIDG